MGVRVHEQIYITGCIPQIARFVRNLEAYQVNLQIAAELLMTCFSKYFKEEQIDLSLNTKDNYQEAFDLEVHEVAHILLNDAGHNTMPGNYMSYVKHAKAFTYSQCERMRNFHEREKGLVDRFNRMYLRFREYFQTVNPSVLESE